MTYNLTLFVGRAIKEEPMSVARMLSVLAALAFALAAPSAALGQQKLKFAHVYETSEPYHTWALWGPPPSGTRRRSTSLFRSARWT